MKRTRKTLFHVVCAICIILFTILSLFSVKREEYDSRYVNGKMSTTHKKKLGVNRHDVIHNDVVEMRSEENRNICGTLTNFWRANFTINQQSATLYVKDPKQNTASRRLIDQPMVYSMSILEVLILVKRLDSKVVFVDFGSGLGEYTFAAAMNNMTVISIELDRLLMPFLCTSVSHFDKKDNIVLLSSNAFTRSKQNAKIKLAHSLSNLMSIPGVGSELWFNTVVLRLNVKDSLYQVLSTSREFFETATVLGIVTKWVTEDDFDAFRFLRSRRYVPFGLDRLDLSFTRLDSNNLPQWPLDVVWIRTEKLRILGLD